MDPNLFHIDWERTFEALVGIIVLSFLVERVCALVFESRWYIRLFEDSRVGAPADAAASGARPGQLYPIKEVSAFALAAVVCFAWDFDAVSIILLSEKTKWVGILLTAGVIAGGSKASIALFHNVMRVRSAAAEERHKLKKEG